MLHLFPDDLSSHGPTKPKTVHLYVASPDPSETLSSWQPNPPVHCCSSPTLGYVGIYMVYFYSQLLYLWQCLFTIQQPTWVYLCAANWSSQSHRTFDRNKGINIPWLQVIFHIIKSLIIIQFSFG